MCSYFGEALLPAILIPLSIGLIGLIVIGLIKLAQKVL